MEPIRVLIADDHPHFRAGLRALLQSTDEVEVIGEAADGEETIALATRLQPDVITMDIKCRGSVASRPPGGSPTTARTSASWCSACSRTTTRCSPRYRPAP